MSRSLTQDIENLLNSHSVENRSNTPDIVLANYMMTCLHAFEDASRARERWYGGNLAPARDGSPWRTVPAEEDTC